MEHLNEFAGDYFYSLPSEVILQIFCFLDASSLLYSPVVHSSWCNFILQYDAILWKPKCLKKWRQYFHEIYAIEEFYLMTWKRAWQRIAPLNAYDLFFTIDDAIARESEDLRLGFQNFHLSGLPKSLFVIANAIKTLSLGYNEFSELPEQFSQLQNLTALDLSQNLFQTFPNCLTSITSLQKLSFFSNQFSSIEFPSGLYLTHLTLGSNSFQFIPDSVSLLQHLHYLTLDRNEIEVLNPKLFELTSLIDLRLEHNKFSEIPKQISQLSNLVEIDLNNNRIKELPNEFYELTELKTLKLENNELSIISHHIGKMIKLNSLYLGNNQIESIHEEISSLQELKTLSLSDNKLKKLPELSSLVNLQYLSANYNLLEEIPSNLDNCKELRVCDFKYNQIRNIPEGLGNPKILNLEGNPIDEKQQTSKNEKQKKKSRFYNFLKKKFS